jgi:hypothetical protein
LEGRRLFSLTKLNIADAAAKPTMMMASERETGPGKTCGAGEKPETRLDASGNFLHGTSFPRKSMILKIWNYNLTVHELKMNTLWSLE